MVDRISVILGMQKRSLIKMSSNGRPSVVPHKIICMVLYLGIRMTIVLSNTEMTHGPVPGTDDFLKEKTEI